ncbi:MAG TPA: site-2 protease family protein [Desulfomonilaceae bacterium]|nr:site-2 protease family protein [Desulfomonilaceae bacterium]
MDSLNISRIVQEIVLILPGFLLAVTVHEYTHGYIAYRLGDPTAKAAGRLTFNPISHLDPIGTLMLVVTRMIGWAKPVPVDPRYLRNPRSDMLWISLGGPAANLITALVLAVLLHGLVFFTGGSVTGQVTTLIVVPLYMILLFGVRINVVLAIFNLIPVPPLDGAKILEGLLPPRQAYQFQKLEPYGFIILIALIFTDAVSYIILPPIRFIEALLLSGLR